ncbi:MAG TPA: preprotein translocase subunit SecE [Dermatophilaceae bacterium]|nr:preprotein translocase subunit SecE [Dermatophilaceae bacterium]
MTDTSTTGTRDSGHVDRERPRRGNLFSRMFGTIALFVNQILDELRKVVRPTRQELLTYTSVVIVFVTIVMLFVFGLDNAFTRLVLWVFGG